MSAKASISIFWFRRDLRLTDNIGLFHALSESRQVLPVFIFDSDILDQLDDRDDRRVTFIHRSLSHIQETLLSIGSSLECRYGKPIDIFTSFFDEFQVDAIYTNHDYEQYALERDRAVSELCAAHGALFRTYKDQVIFEKLEVCKDNQLPYTVFTPYSRKWKALLSAADYEPANSEGVLGNMLKRRPVPLPSLESMGFQPASDDFPESELNEELVSKYKEQRDYPAIAGTSRLGVHLRFGTVSIRQLVRLSMPLSETYLNELIWREFYQQILANFPAVGLGKAFKPEYDAIKWRNNETEFQAWCDGNTGFPIIDAGMRELNATGFMHNRVRMIVASFLTKDLLIDWRWGEAYFARKLLDFDLASNNGGWQWAAGSGCDAAPYFRVFNPSLQTIKFDKKLEYVRRWVPEFETLNYARPIVAHDFARKRCLEVYAAALSSFR